MKYLSLLLLLCCACCKVAIQAFVQEDRQKIQKKTCKSLTQHRQLDRRQRIAKKLQHFTTFTDGHNHRHGYRRHHQRMAHIPMRAIVRLPGWSAQLPTESPTDMENPMRLCSDTQLLTDLPADFKKFGGIFKILSVNFKKYRRN